MDKVHKTITTRYHTLSPKPFRIYPRTPAFVNEYFQNMQSMLGSSRTAIVIVYETRYD
jgi:hypothetical protein